MEVNVKIADIVLKLVFGIGLNESTQGTGQVWLAPSLVSLRHTELKYAACCSDIKSVRE